MTLFGYTDNQDILLGNGESRYEPWGSSIQGVWFSSWYVVSIDIGHIWLKVHSPAQDGVLLSRWSLFCLFPPSSQCHIWISNHRLQSNSSIFSLSTCMALFFYISIPVCSHICC